MSERICSYCNKHYSDNGYNPKPFGGYTPFEYCSRACYDAHQAALEKERQRAVQAKKERLEAKKAKREEKEAKKEKKAAAAADKLEKSKTTSQESLEKITRLCMIGGIVGLHRFAVGKIKSAILLDLVIVAAIFEAFFSTYGFQPNFLGLLLINVAFWLFDLATLKAKKFTDKYGYTIRE